MFSGLGLADVGEKSRVGRAAFNVVPARFVEAQLAVDGESHFRSVSVFLAVIFPPADRAKLESSGRFESFVPTTRTAIAHFDRGTHAGMDGKSGSEIT